jgi:hypothetical protein
MMQVEDKAGVDLGIRLRFDAERGDQPNCIMPQL